jgi:hypothetical protein
MVAAIAPDQPVIHPGILYYQQAVIIKGHLLLSKPFIQGFDTCLRIVETL